MSRKYMSEARIIYAIVQDFMAQSGDPTGTGRGGTSIYGNRLSVLARAAVMFMGTNIPL